MKQKIKIGTRASPLALAQVDLFMTALKKHHPHLQAPDAIEIVKITTSGDMSQSANVPLAAMGGDKGLFAKEIEDALLAGTIDCAVHSMKDMPGALPEGLMIPCYLPREDARDVFFSHKAKTIDDLPQGAVVGTSSPRRQAITLARRPDLKVVTFRGNVGTRLKKLDDGEVDATYLALAGLNRLGRADAVTSVLDPDIMLPAAGQGVIGIEVREKDTGMQALLHNIHCAVTDIRISAERAFLNEMGGSCRTPLAAYMEVPDSEGRVRFDVLAANPDGSDMVRHSYLMAVQHKGDAERLGVHAAKEMKAKCKVYL